jgi:methionyl-tRNA formyltransferase
MGTPDFAVPTLKTLLEEGHQVVGVVTAADKPAGRGQKLKESAVKQYAKEKELPVLQPTNLKSSQFNEALKALQPDLNVVVAFRMLPEVVWDLPTYGTINLHASLLPDYRGAAPINWAIVNGETETGVTTFFITQNIDTGDLIYQKKVPIGPDKTAGELHDRLMAEGAQLVLQSVDAIERGEHPQTPQQQSSEIKKAPKITKEMCRIDWQQEPPLIHNLIRGLSPFPGARTSLNGKILKIYRSRPEPADHQKTIPSIHTDNKSELKVAVHGGWLHLLDVQLEGKKRMGVEEFLRGIDPNELTLDA